MASTSPYAHIPFRHHIGSRAARCTVSFDPTVLLRSPISTTRRSKRCDERRIITTVFPLWSSQFRATPIENFHPEDGPSCMFIGPLNSASQSDLELFYLQARDEYYSGRPLIVDEMFDKVEERLRKLRSSLVQKYPRCSLRKLAVYSDAEWDETQMKALKSVWASLLLLGAVITVAPPLLIAHTILQSQWLDHFSLHELYSMGLSSTLTVNAGFIVLASALLGVSLSLASARSLMSLQKGEMAALRGCCPACGEEVYAFIRVDALSMPRHKCECHVCDQPLVFHVKLEETAKDRIWGYGRIYLVVRSKDLNPERGT